MNGRAPVRYVLLNPTGNLTCLVLDPVAPEDRPRITEQLMSRCEQVGYLMSPKHPEARARLEMMGGEFCGNASMATAVWLAAREGPVPDAETAATGPEADAEEEEEILLEVSGAEEPVPCRVRRDEDGAWHGRVQMPLPGKIRPVEIAGKKLTAIYLPGMTHLIRNGGELSREEAEMLLREAGRVFPDPAVGLLQWREDDSAPDKVLRRNQRGAADPACRPQKPEKAGTMIPLVWVRGSDTMVWETACGSGTEAVACMESALMGRSVRLSVRQPGGILKAETEWDGNTVRQVILSGTVRMEPEQFL